jgi:ubiquinone/menaquinone biosynthesis C-methylase UbiE
MPRFIPAVLLLLCRAAVFAQATHPVTGREIAPVMGYGGAGWLVRPERIDEEAPDRALDAIGIKRGDVIADIGAGVGYFTWRMAERTGTGGRIYASDIQPRMLEELKKNIASRGLTNVTPVLGTEDDPRLPAAALDMALLVDVYHEFSQPQKMLARIRAALKPGGRLVLLEYRKEDPTVPIREEHKMTVQQVRAEIEPEGFRFETSLETLPRQHILIFRPYAQNDHPARD